MSKPRMPLEIAKTILRSSKRHTLSDYAFGDKEVHWTSNGVAIADAYVGRTGLYLTMGETNEYRRTTFDEQEINSDFLTHGTYGSFERNDNIHH